MIKIISWRRSAEFAQSPWTLRVKCSGLSPDHRQSFSLSADPKQNKESLLLLTSRVSREILLLPPPLISLFNKKCSHTAYQFAVFFFHSSQFAYYSRSAFFSCVFILRSCEFMGGRKKKTNAKKKRWWWYFHQNMCINSWWFTDEVTQEFSGILLRSQSIVKLSWLIDRICGNLIWHHIRQRRDPNPEPNTFLSHRF